MSHEPDTRPAGGDVISATTAEVIGVSPIEQTSAGELLEPEHELLGWRPEARRVGLMAGLAAGAVKG